MTNVDLSMNELRMIYDAIISGMDWGSGFLSTDESIAVIKLGFAIGAEPPACGASGGLRKGKYTQCCLIKHHVDDHEYVVVDPKNPMVVKVVPLRSSVEE